MYPGSTIIRIGKVQNGYTVGLNDPEIVKQNRKRNETKGECPPWRDPEVTYFFKTKEEVSEFIVGNIDKVMPVDEFSSTFDQAAKEASDE